MKINFYLLNLTLCRYLKLIYQQTEDPVLPSLLILTVIFSLNCYSFNFFSVNMAGCTTDCVEKPISICFQRFGRFVGTHPWWFFISPLFISAVLGSGFYFLQDREANDIEDQFTPVNGPAKLERQFVQENFPLNDSVFSNQRLYTDGVYASFIAVSTSSNILVDAAFQEIVTLDRKVRELNVSMGHEVLTFEGLCARRYNKCLSNKILDIYRYYEKKEEKTELTFPSFRFGFSYIFLGYSVGGVNVNGSVIKSAKAVRLFYFLKDHNRSRTDLWLNEFLRVFSSNLSLNFIKVGIVLFLNCCLIWYDLYICITILGNTKISFSTIS